MQNILGLFGCGVDSYPGDPFLYQFNSFLGSSKDHRLRTVHDLVERELKAECGYFGKAGSEFYKLQCKLVYYSLLEQFRAIECEESRAAWLQRAHLLNTLFLLRKANPELPSVEVGKSQLKEFNPDSVPLVSFYALKIAKRAFEELENREGLDLVKLQTEIPLLHEEKQNTARIVRLLVTPKETKIGQWITNFFQNQLRNFSRIIGWLYDFSLSGYSEKNIANFSLQLGIASTEVIAVKNGKGKYTHYYRAPEELYGKDLDSFSTLNKWFARDLTDDARNEYLARMKHKEAKLERKYGKAPAGASRTVISNSFCRLHIETLQPGEFSLPQQISGKVLNQQAAQKAKSNGDDAVYYANTYGYSNADLFAVGRELAFQDEYAKKQHQLLHEMHGLLEQTGAIQLVHRLAPSDIHSYVAALNGRPLTNLEAANKLKEYLQAKQAHSGLSENLETSISSLEELYKYFEEHGKGKEQSTIDLLGSVKPVAAAAIKIDPGILAENDRKIMMFEHPDGGFSFHVFIGATGVNRVDVSTEVEQLSAGQRLGDMQFGIDTYQVKGKRILQHHTRKGHKKLKFKEKTTSTSVGCPIGQFEINESTIISLFLPHEFKVEAKLSNFANEAYYGAGEKRAKVEVRAHIGDVLLTKRAVVAAELIERAFPELFQAAEFSLENLRAVQLPTNTLKQEENFKYDQQIFDETIRILNQETRNYEDQLFLNELIELLRQRYQIINA